ncbi:MAG: SagB/ThcOx family dehydrogenase [Desulfotignum sp.]|nr:SagB/ThcOx family dehydrogenase [Desulfotignum sp.]
MPESGVSAVQYHERTSHVRHRISPHYLDFSNYPAPFKIYEYQDRIPLKREGGFVRDRNGPMSPGELDATVEEVLGDQLASDEPLNLKTVSQILGISYGVTPSDRGRGLLFRNVPSAGGLYPCQLYLSAQKADNIETGLYYCDTVQRFLGRINPRPLDLKVIFPDREVSDACLIITGIFFNSAWKYRERAFRYLLLDGGHLAEAVVQASRAAGVQARICYDFDDQSLMQGLSLDASLEVPLACVFLCPGSAVSSMTDSVPSQPAVTGPDQRVPVVYDILSKAYQAGTWIAAKSEKEKQPPVFSRDPVREIPVPPPGRFQGVSFVRAVAGRRSRRNFAIRELPAPVWSAFLNFVFNKMVTGQALDETGADAEPFLKTAMICQQLQGVPSGLYSFSRDGRYLACRQTVDLAGDLARVCLDQAWIGRAAVNFLVLADLAAVEAALGSRGYRYVMMRAGRIGQRLYLAAEALGLGCCGIGAMYDREAADLLGLTSGSRLLYAVSAGPVK